MHCVILITCALALNGSMVITNLQNPLDLAPNYAGTLFSMMNITGYTSGILAPLIISLFVAEDQVKRTTIVFFFIGNHFYR